LARLQLSRRPKRGFNKQIRAMRNCDVKGPGRSSNDKTPARRSGRGKSAAQRAVIFYRR
jgi:hypothetical protein